MFLTNSNFKWRCHFNIVTYCFVLLLLCVFLLPFLPSPSSIPGSWAGQPVRKACFLLECSRWGKLCFQISEYFWVHKGWPIWSWLPGNWASRGSPAQEKRLPWALSLCWEAAVCLLALPVWWGREGRKEQLFSFPPAESKSATCKAFSQSDSISGVKHIHLRLSINFNELDRWWWRDT